jgi:hypothetical protein
MTRIKIARLILAAYQSQLWNEVTIDLGSRASDMSAI